MTKLLAAVTAALFAPMLLAPGVSQARYDTADIFSSPSRAIYCQLLQNRPQGGNGVRCVVPSAGHDGRWRYFELHEQGGTQRFASDNYPDLGIVPKIPYGATWAMVGGTPKIGPLHHAINCTSRRTGLTCQNRSGHGFRLSRERQIRF